MRTSLLVALLICFVSPLVVAAAELSPGEEFFEKQVRPLLVARCVKCHGGEKTEAGLSLTSRAAVLRGGDSGALAVAGKPVESLLMEVVGYQGDIQMPPAAKLPEAEIAILRKWVELSLPWPNSAEADPNPAAQKFQISDEQRKFWAFQPLVRHAPPQVKDTAWAIGTIDAFVLARLEAEGLAPTTAADKRTLLRRLSFDLIGLPPTPEETAAYLSDTSPQAYSRQVDRLLRSPQYGERWGRHWLDVVRYTDSFDSRIVGSNNEMECNDAWRYRDWVVDALNRDLPYDQFIQQQIAGDILPGDGEDGFNRAGTIATGMLALGNWGGGDSDKEKLLTDIADDQVDVVSRAFLGVTVACARCHDHKFDPISTEDYYAMAGIFFSSHILRDPGPKTNGPPMLRIPLASPQELQRRQQYESRVKRLVEQSEKARDEAIVTTAKTSLTKLPAYLRAVEQWDGQSSEQLQKLAATDELSAPVVRRWHEYLGRGNRKLLTKPERDVRGIAGLMAYSGNGDTPSFVANTTDREVSFLTIKLPPRVISMHPGQQAAVAMGWSSPFTGKVSVKGRVVDGDSVCGNGIAWRLAVRSGSSVREFGAGMIGNGGSVEINPVEVEVASGELLELAVLPNGEYSCDTTVVDLDITELAGEKRSWNLTRDWLADYLSGNPHADRYGQRDVWQCYELASGATPQVTIAPESQLARFLASSVDADALLQAVTASRSDDKQPDAAWLKDYLSPRGMFWTSLREREEILPLEAKTALANVRSELDTLRKSPLPPLEFANGCQEGGCPSSAHAGVHNVRVHIRGRYDRLGPEVPRRFPVILAGEQQTPVQKGSGRRELAEWVGSARQPLAARVMANRIWQHHFGRGIVGTPNNFGKLGTRPTHPELLDYLATRLIDGGWSLKALHRELLLSATYQQSSIASAAALERDPGNQFWGRMDRRRLEAEAIRDAMLLVSNRLDLKMQGPATRGFDHTRRTLYAMTIRSDRSTFRELFDAADSTAVVEARVTSTVAPQALYFLNHPFTEQTALSLAERALREGEPATDARVQQLHRWLYNREANEKELALAQRLLGDAPDLPRWQRYCHVLLCANEFVYVD